MDNLAVQSTLLETQPVVYNVANFAKPAPGQPALISFDDVTTMFHEFGHALHGLFASQQYPTLSGTAVARDFVEFPSQFNEHWALDPKVFAHYAVHHQTGEPMPQDLVDKIKKSRELQSGVRAHRILAAADLDLAWHMMTPAAAHAVRQRQTNRPRRLVRDARAHRRASRPPASALAVPVELFPPYLGQRLFRGLLRVSLDRDARR